MRCTMLVLILTASLFTGASALKLAKESGNQEIRGITNSELHDAIAHAQDSCSIHPIYLGFQNGGGFTSKLSMAAKDMMGVLLLGYRVNFAGPIGAYTTEDCCPSGDASHTCFFEPVTRCTRGVTKDGTPDGPIQKDGPKNQARHHGKLKLFTEMAATEDGKSALYDGVLAYITRLNNFTQGQVEKMQTDIDYIPGEQYVAVHIRDTSLKGHGQMHKHALTEYTKLVEAENVSPPSTGADKRPFVFIASDGSYSDKELNNAMDSDKYKTIRLDSEIKAAKCMNGWGILFDFHMLSHATRLVGTYASNVSRWAAAVRRALAEKRIPTAVMLGDAKEREWIDWAMSNVQLPQSKNLVLAGADLPSGAGR